MVMSSTEIFALCTFSRLINKHTFFVSLGYSRGRRGEPQVAIMEESSEGEEDQPH